MAVETELFDLSFQASPNAPAVTWSGNPPVAGGGIPQYAAVVIDGTAGNFDVTLPAGAGALIVGINQSQQPTGPGATCQVRQIGVSKALASAAITEGQTVYVANVSGQLGPAPAAGATNVFCVGIALTAASAAGDLFSVLLIPGLTTQITA